MMLIGMFHMSFITKNDVGGGWWRITAYLCGVMVLPLHVRLIIIDGGLSNQSPCLPALVEEGFDGVGGSRVDASLRWLYMVALLDQLLELIKFRRARLPLYVVACSIITRPRVCGCHS